MKQDEIIEMARHISKVFGSRMCDENGDTHNEELYCMTFDDIVDAVKLVETKERTACFAAAYASNATKSVLQAIAERGWK